MHVAVVQRLVVDLVGQDDQLVLAGHLDDLPEHALGIQRAGRVVRVDDDDRLGVARHLALDVLDVGHPVGLLVAQVVHRRAAGQGHRGGVQRVVGRRDQHLVAAVEQRVQAHGDELGGAVAEVDIVHRHAADVLFLRVVHHRLARREQALAVGVASRMRHVADHVLHDLVRRFQAEHGEVADVQLDDLVALFLHLPGLVEHRSADVVADVGQLARLGDGFQRASWGSVALQNIEFNHEDAGRPP